MNTVELAKVLAEDTGLSAAKAESLIKQVFGRITEEVCKGGTVKIHQFGHFAARGRKARVGVNPQTKEAIQIKEQRVAHWSVSVAIKECLNGSRDTDTLFEGVDAVIVNKKAAAAATPAAPAATTTPAAPATPATPKAEKKAAAPKAAKTAAPAAPPAPAATGTTPPPPPA